MNKNLSNYARTEILKGLSQCTEAQHHLFKQMYAKGKLELSIEEVVKNMDDDRLDWAMQHWVHTNLKKLNLIGVFPKQEKADINLN